MTASDNPGRLNSFIRALTKSSVGSARATDQVARHRATTQIAMRRTEASLQQNILDGLARTRLYGYRRHGGILRCGGHLRCRLPPCVSMAVLPGRDRRDRWFHRPRPSSKRTTAVVRWSKARRHHRLSRLRLHSGPDSVAHPARAGGLVDAGGRRNVAVQRIRVQPHRREDRRSLLSRFPVCTGTSSRCTCSSRAGHRM